MARIEANFGIPSGAISADPCHTDSRRKLARDGLSLEGLMPTGEPEYLPPSRLEDQPPVPRERPTKRMPSTHRSILYRDLQGQTVHHISEALGIALSNIKMVMDSPIYKSEKARISEAAEQKIKRSKDRLLDMQERALEIAEDLMDHEDPKIQTIMVRDILDRSGLKPMERRRTEVFDAARMIEAAYKARNSNAGSGTNSGGHGGNGGGASGAG